MTDNDAWVLQVSPKLPDGTLVNIRGKDAFAFADALALAEEKAGDIARVVALLSGTGNLANAGVTGQTQAAAPQQFTPAQPQYAPQQQAAPAAPAAGGGPVCKHGAMTRRTGNGKRGPWVGHFCPTPKGTPDQCEPIFGDA